MGVELEKFVMNFFLNMVLNGYHIHFIHHVFTDIFELLDIDWHVKEMLL